MSENERLTISYKAVYIDCVKGAGTVSGQDGQIAHPGFQFAHPGFNNMGVQRPSCDYL